MAGRHAERGSKTGRANNEHLSASQPFRLFERYTAPAPLLWGHKRDKKQELGHKDLQGHLQTRQVTCVFSTASICQQSSRGHLEMNKLVMFTWFHKHYGNLFPLPRSHTSSALQSVRLRNFKYYSWKKLEESVAGLGYIFRRAFFPLFALLSRSVCGCIWKKSQCVMTLRLHRTSSTCANLSPDFTGFSHVAHRLPLPGWRITAGGMHVNT